MLIIAVLIMDTKYNLDNSVFYVFIISSNPQTNRVQIIIHSFDPMNNIRRFLHYIVTFLVPLEGVSCLLLQAGP